MIRRRKTSSHRKPLPAVALRHGRIEMEGTAKQAIETGRTRLVIAGAIFALAFATVGARLIDLAILIDGNEPRIAHSPVIERFTTERADIRDRNDELLATSLITASLYADPALVLDVDEAARDLAMVLPELSEASIRAKLSTKGRFVWLRRNLTPRQVYDVNRLGLPGLAFQREERRVYPHGSLASHILGFTNIDNRGLAGAERQFDDILIGGSRPLNLSLDLRVQYVLEEELAAAQQEFSAIGAAGIVMDVVTGEVLAMASLPGFDPNHPVDGADDTRFNRATLGVYEMGSTFKIFTTAMALDAGTVTMRGGYDATNPIRVARFTISDFHAKKRWLSVPEIFMYSSNIGAAKMALDVGSEGQEAFLRGLGLLTPSSIELPEVGAPMLPSPWREINTMTVSFGHGVAVSPIQLASAVSTVVNGGLAVPATILKRAPNDPIPVRRAISAETSENMRRLLRLVVTEGTGKNAEAQGYLVGGKTGTAEKLGAHGGYQRRALLSSFVGAFPMNNPRYVVLAILDEPKGTKATYGYATGGWVAAPVVGKVVTRIASVIGVNPLDENAPEIREAFAVELNPRGTTLASY